jgi:nickel transport protein
MLNLTSWNPEMLNAKLFLALATVTLLTGDLRHGIEVKFTLNAPAVVVTCTYSGSDTVADAEFVLFTPAGENEEFQRGHTDNNGVFSFIPDVAGEWKVVVDDGQGHREEVSVHVTETFLSDAEITPATAELLRSGGGALGSMPLWMKAVWGLSLIFGLAGILYLVRARKTVRK